LVDKPEKIRVYESIQNIKDVDARALVWRSWASKSEDPAPAEKTVDKGTIKEIAKELNDRIATARKAVKQFTKSGSGESAEQSKIHDFLKASDTTNRQTKLTIATTQKAAIQTC
jgi:hypothetical protein